MIVETPANEMNDAGNEGASNPYLTALGMSPNNQNQSPLQDNNRGTAANEQQAQQQKNEDPERVGWMAQLSKKDRFLSKREMDLKDREKALEDKYGGYSDKFSKLEELKKSGDPMKVLEEFGYTQDDVIDRYLGSDMDSEDRQTKKADPVVQQMADQIKKLEEMITGQVREREEEKANNNLHSIKSSLSEQLKANVDKYEILNHVGNEAVDLIKNLMDSYKAQNGEDVDFHIAAKYAEELYEKKFSGLRSLKKFSGSDNQDNSQDYDQQQHQQQQQQQQQYNPTLSNNDVAGSFNQNDDRNLTEEDLIKKAAGMLRFTE